LNTISQNTATTIVAPATPPGVSALAVVRISGPAVATVCAQVLGGCALRPREMRLVTACEPGSNVPIDTLLAVFFPGPNSYTGEDILELFPHGNPLLVRHLVQAVRQVPGVRLAEPGEFTRRAFLHGKLDLVQAEAVGELLNATAETALQNARQLLRGKLSTQVRQLAETVKQLSVRLELAVDFSEEEASPDLAQWQPRLQEIQCQLSTLQASFRAQPRNHVPQVVLYGAPNAGKSSLVNALLAEDRVLVSAVPGTTRDYVEVRLLLPGGEVHLVDTAGLAEQAQDELDERSMRKSRAVLENADWAVLVLDASNVLPPEASAWLAQAQEKGHGIVLSKCDLPNVVDNMPNALRLSTASGMGLDDLVKRMDQTIFPPKASAEECWLSSERQLDCIHAALCGTERALELFSQDWVPVELLAFEMQTVRDALRSITGELSSEDVLQAIFSGFCIGK
jgi:tRNA modification GTPase